MIRGAEPCGIPGCEEPGTLYVVGLRCPADAPRQPTRDEASTAWGLFTSDRDEWARQRANQDRYGTATTDPLGRTGWVKDHRLPKRHDKVCDAQHGIRDACNKALKPQEVA